MYKKNNFDWKFYINYHTDLKRKHINNENDAYKHYIKFGKKENRIINAHQILKKNIKTLGLQKIAVLTSINRNNFINNLINNFMRQKWNNKKLFLCINKNNINTDNIKKKLDKFKIKYKIIKIDEKKNLGYCLNKLIILSNEEDCIYCTKFDDDDIYMEEYLNEQISHIAATKVSLIGKFHINVYFPEENKIYYIKEYNKENKFTSSICGSTITFITKDIIDNKLFFNEKIHKGTDKKFIACARLEKKMKIFATSSKNYVCVRYTKPEYNIHTWQGDIKKTLTFIENVNFNKKILYNYLSNNNYDNLFNKKNIFQIYISPSLKHLGNRIKTKYNLKQELNNNNSAIFFGIYDINDYNTLINFDGDKYIIFGGSEIDERTISGIFMKNKITSLKNNYFFALSNCIQKRLNNYNIESEIIKFNLVDNDIFKPCEKLGNSIYIYDGLNKKEYTNIIYGKKYFDEVTKKLKNFNFIFSSDLKLENKDMPEIYKKCFIGLRLTEKDGNANTVQEFESMNIPIIHNGSEYGLKWNSIKDIIKHIYNFYIKNKMKKNENFDYNFYSQRLSKNIIKNTQENIQSFCNLIKPFNNILMISSDFPGYGGAATNCNNLAKFFMKQNNVFQIYYTHKDDNFKKYNTNKNYIIINEADLENELHTLNFNYDFIPDLIILKSFIPINLKLFFNCPIFFLIPGIFRNYLDKYFYNLNDKEIKKKYINKKIIEEISKSDCSFCNSIHTKEILDKYYNKKTFLFYSSFINCSIKKNKNFENRKYDYGIVISDFNRNIKNIRKSLEILKNEKNIILIGKNSEKFKNENTTCLPFIDNSKIEYYYQDIKYIVNNSFYESSSNVLVEAFLNGCRSLKNNFININWNNFKNMVILEPHITYIFSRNSIELYDEYFIDKINNKHTKNFNFLYFIDNGCNKDFIIIIRLDHNYEENIIKMIKKSTIIYENIGYCKNFNKDSHDIAINYYIYGKLSIDLDFIGLSLFYKDYTDYKNILEDRTYNKNTLIFCANYYFGINKIPFDKEKINKVIKQFKFHEIKCIFISKPINSYGGNQKTGLQILKLLDQKYNVTIINFKNTKLLNIIPQYLIINLDSYENIVDYVNNNLDYEFLFNNKLNEIMCYINKFYKHTKIYILTHNSMDLFNNLIIDNKKYIYKTFTVNNFHKKLLQQYDISNIDVFKNYVTKTNKVETRTSFRYKIVYVGRLSTEKNIDFLINTFNYISKEIPQLKLYIIGSGNKYKSSNQNIIFTGYLNKTEIKHHLLSSDYLILPSYTEGLPFCILEAMNLGIPCITSNIVGVNEIVKNNSTGFLFDITEYNTVKNNINDWEIKYIFKQYEEENIINLIKTIKKSFNINIKTWNNMSKTCYEFINNYYSEENSIKYNLRVMDMNNKNNKIKLFINFKPRNNTSYGGGNIFTLYLKRLFERNESIFTLTFNLDDDIDIYLIIDPFKDNNYKMYSLEDTILHKNKINNNGIIILRINDCDRTRTKVWSSRSREKNIIHNIKDINYIIYNSNFIKDYYINQYEDIKNIKNTVIINGCDQNIFSYKNSNKLNKDKIKVVTHHWSSNLFKGYQIYYDMFKHCQNNEKYEFVFIGKNIPEIYNEMKIIGPYHGKELSNELKKCDIYLTDSKYDSCPNHVLEAISTGLPILYTSCNGGGKEIIESNLNKIGESYNHFDDLLLKLDKITDNYETYKNNIKMQYNNFNINISNTLYYDKLKEALFSKRIYHTKINGNNNYILTIKNTNKKKGYIILKNKKINLLSGINCIIFNYDIKIDKYNEIEIYVRENCNIKDIFIEFNDKKSFEKFDNNYKVNFLLSSDVNYFVGLFANIKSILLNTNAINYNKLYFNFIIPIENANYFTKLLILFENKLSIKLNKTIIYLDKYILDPIIFNSKCYNGGNHLLNIANFSRLLIGEFFRYNKLIYLDSDSIVQTDIYKKIEDIELKEDIYAFKMDYVNKNKKESIVLNLNVIINTDYDWKKIIGYNIDSDDTAFMGAPFITNCKKWDRIYDRTIEIIKNHNKYEGGLYKLFTMSIQNILFYKKMGDIKQFLLTIPDLGSKRKEWSKKLLKKADILDWSGIYKPWYNNGLHIKLWNRYDFENLSNKYNNINESKGTIEFFNDNKILIDYRYIKFDNIKNADNANEYIVNLINKSNNIIYINELIRTGQINNPKIKSDKRFKILYFINVDFLIRKMSRVRFWPIEKLFSNKNISIFLNGVGFTYYKPHLSLQQNIISMNVDFDFVILYKPFEDNIIFDSSCKLPFPVCMRYNEMWDEEWTYKEISDSKSDLIICHHLNDFEKYNKKYNNIKFKYNPHHADNTIFKKLDSKKDIDILISGVTKEKHYPLKFRLLNLINKNIKRKLKKYKIKHLKHPKYWHDDAYTNKVQKNYCNLINKSKICIACTSKHNYRLGKYVEIPMCGSVICGDIPYEDKESFKQFVVEVNMEMSDSEILNKIINILEDEQSLLKKAKIGYEWAQNYTTEKYCDKLIKQLKNFASPNKIYIISDEIKDNHPEFKNQKWICDILKQDFIKKYPNCITTDPKDAKIIWYLASWNTRHIPNNLTVLDWFKILTNKKVIFTMHHIDMDKFKLGTYDKQFKFMMKYGNKYHTICQKTHESLVSLNHNIPSYKEYLWYDPDVFFPIEDNIPLKNKYNISKSAYLIGSFQKDTEGNKESGIQPKLSKGPDLFIKIIRHMYITNKNIEIILTGLRREYIIEQLKKLNIKYYYFNMISLKELNELYNCLDLYIISSRYEGGPRSVFEAGATKTPIISTKVGIADELIARESLFDMNNIITYKNAIPNVAHLSRQIEKLTIENQIYKIKDLLLN
jgi:glycosyltransferase involved in cell wall biosynthesis